MADSNIAALEAEMVALLQKARGAACKAPVVQAVSQTSYSRWAILLIAGCVLLCLAGFYAYGYFTRDTQAVETTAEDDLQSLGPTYNKLLTQAKASDVGTHKPQRKDNPDPNFTPLAVALTGAKEASRSS